MEENMETNSQNIEENKNETAEPKKSAAICKYFKEYLGILIAAFLGGFLAIYFVADQVLDKPQPPQAQMYMTPDMFAHQMMREMQRMYERDRRAFERDFQRFEKDFDKDFNKPFNKPHDKQKNNWKHKNKPVEKVQNEPVNPFMLPAVAMEDISVKSKIDDDEYKIEIGLKAFQGDENKIKYNVKGNKLSVWGDSVVQEKNFKKEVSFSQSFILPKNADLSKITKTRDEDKLVIKVPLKTK